MHRMRLGTFFFNERESSLSLCYFLVCLTTRASYLYDCRILSRKIGLIGTFAPSPSHMPGHVMSANWKMQVPPQTMPKMRVGNAKLVYQFSVKLQRRLLPPEKQMNERGERSANNVPRIPIKVSGLLLSIWAAEMLLWFLIKKGKILKEMWAACPGDSFRSQPHLAKPARERMLAGVAGQAEPLAKLGGRWIVASRGLCQDAQAAHLVPSSLQFTSRAGVELVTPASSRHHQNPFLPQSAALLTLISLTSASVSTNVGDTSMLRRPEEEGNASPSSAMSPLPRKGTPLVSQFILTLVSCIFMTWSQTRV